MDKGYALNKIAAEILENTELPLYEYRTAHNYMPVAGSGDVNAGIMLVGEAPGEQEAVSGEPFVGRAGRVLSDLLTLGGILRNSVFITSVVKDRPPKNRTPTIKEVNAYLPYLLLQMEVIRPKVIVCLGNLSLATVSKVFDLEVSPIGKTHGVTKEAQATWGIVLVMGMYHPAALFYNPRLKADMEKDMKRLGELIKEI